MKVDGKFATYDDVRKAIREGNSIRGAAKLLGKSPTALQWWIARNGYRVEHRAVLVRVRGKDTR